MTDVFLAFIGFPTSNTTANLIALLLLVFWPAIAFISVFGSEALYRGIFQATKETRHD